MGVVAPNVKEFTIYDDLLRDCVDGVCLIFRRVFLRREKTNHYGQGARLALARLVHGAELYLHA